MTTRSCPGGSGQKPEVRSRGEEGKTEASISRGPQVSKSRDVEVSSVKVAQIKHEGPLGGLFYGDNSVVGGWGGRCGESTNKGA